MSRPLYVTPGDPMGIGPEVTVKALRECGDAIGEVVVLGDVAAFLSAGGEAVVAGSGGRVRLLAPADATRPAEWSAVVEGARLCMDGAGRALVTGPIHKARLAAQGFPYTGHTDLLAAICGCPGAIMAFVGGSVRVVLVTVHVALREVPALITKERVSEVIRHSAWEFATRLRMPRPRIVVCGLNPHAGEGGLLGSEDIDEILPGVEDARRHGIDVRGPVSAEEAFMDPAASDLIVAMYHDQGLVPLKRVDFGRTVNWTMGLPFVRTSVDHGTADALVGTGKARPDSMIAALRLADQLSR